MDLLYAIDLTGTFVFAISGAMAAADHKIDVVGAAFTGFVTAIGGGSLRDIFLNMRPVWVDDGNYLLAIVFGVLVAISTHQLIGKLRRTMFMFDALGISFFTIVGLQKSLGAESSQIAAIVLGLFSAIMGGVTRDTLLNDVPLIFRKEVYATACLSGAITFILLAKLGISENLNAFLSAALIFLIRTISVRYRLTLPIVGG